MIGADFSGYTIGSVKLRSALVLSPMSGVTCSAFRQLIRLLNGDHVGLLVSEFVSVEGMTRGSQRTLEMMRYREHERPYAIQIFGHDPDRMRDAALMVEQAGADIVDINCGCPAPKVVRRGGGCELMRQPEHLAKIFREVRRAVKIPLTMKMRSGWDDNSKNAIEIARMVEAEGLDAIAVHGRTRAQLYRGDADWQVVNQVAEAVSIPVAGSGDVIDRAGAISRRTGKIAGLFIGRGALQNPFIFREIASGESGILAKNPGYVFPIIESYVQLLRQDLSERCCVGRLKQLLSQMGRAYEWRKDFLRAMTLGDQLGILEREKERWISRGGSVLISAPVI